MITIGYAQYKNAAGRLAGYAVKATCDHPNCGKVIDRGLDFCCGGRFGVEVRVQSPDQVPCGKYFCHDHLTGFAMCDTEFEQVCEQCKNKMFPCFCDTGDGPVDDCWLCHGLDLITSNQREEYLAAFNN